MFRSSERGKDECGTTVTGWSVTLFQVKVDVLLLCGDKLESWNCSSTHTMVGKKLLYYVKIEVPTWNDSVKDLNSATLSWKSAESCIISWVIVFSFLMVDSERQHCVPYACSLTYFAQTRLAGCHPHMKTTPAVRRFFAETRSWSNCKYVFQRNIPCNNDHCQRSVWSQHSSCEL